MFKPYDLQKRALDKILEIKDREIKLQKLQAFIDAEKKPANEEAASESKVYHAAPKLKSRQLIRAEHAMQELQRPEVENLPTLEFLSSEDALDLNGFNQLAVSSPTHNRR